MWFNIGFAIAVLALTALTVYYLRHDPDTCKECARRREPPMTHPSGLCMVCGDVIWDREAHDRIWHG